MNRNVILIAASFALLQFGSTVPLFGQDDKRVNLVWHLHRDANSIDQVEWPKSVKGSRLVFKDAEFEMMIGLPGMRMLAGLCDRVEVRRSEEVIEAVTLFCAPMTKENTGYLIQSYRKVFDLLEDERISKKVTKWKEEGKSFTFGNSRIYPLVSIDVAKSFDGKKPWHMIVRLNFVKLEDRAHPETVPNRIDRQGG